jgi:hypothetical protein
MGLFFSLRQQLMAQRAAHSAEGDEGKFTGQHVGDETELGDVFSHFSGGMPESLASISCISHKRVLVVVFFLKITENEIRKSKFRRNASLLYEYRYTTTLREECCTQREFERHPGTTSNKTYVYPHILSLAGAHLNYLLNSIKIFNNAS